MIRPLLVLAAMSFGLACVREAAAQTPPPSEDPARFSIHRTETGYARLDLRTGQISVCSPRGSAWACQAAADDRSVFEGEIARLQSDNAKLKKALLDRGLPLPAGMAADPSGAPQGPKSFGSGLPSEADIDRAISFLERMWRRLVDMMGLFQRDVGKT
jgi:hypothetical protein